MKPAEVSTPDDTSVVVKRTFAAPAQLVWAAYTEAGLLKRWCPMVSWPAGLVDARV